MTANMKGPCAYHGWHYCNHCYTCLFSPYTIFLRRITSFTCLFFNFQYLKSLLLNVCSNVYGMNDNYIIVSSLKAETVSYLYLSHSPGKH